MLTVFIFIVSSTANAEEYISDIIMYNDIQDAIAEEATNISCMINQDIENFEENNFFYENEDSFYTEERNENVINALRKHARNLRHVLNKLTSLVKMPKRKHCCACACFHKEQQKKALKDPLR